MCDIGMAIGLASSMLGAVGQMQQAQAEADAANYRAQVDEMNARRAELQAKDRIQRGTEEERAKQRQHAAFKGKREAGFAAAGIDTAFGSALASITSTEELMVEDELTIRANAGREAVAYQYEATNHKASARLNRYQASSAKTGGFLAAGASLLTGASGAYKGWKTAQIGALA